MKMATYWYKTALNGCEELILDKKTLEKVKAAKFDLAYAHFADLCSIGYIHAAKIPAWIWLIGGGMLDHVAIYLGIPSPPGYVPSYFSEYGDIMTFTERFKSFAVWLSSYIMIERLQNYPATELFRKYFGKEFPMISDLARRAPLAMINSNELYELARPTLSKVINIGGLGMAYESAKNLTGEYRKIVSDAKGIIIFSLGTVTNASLMPDTWKKAFAEAFSQFPNYHFICRYPTQYPSPFTSANIHVFDWIPQRDLLHNSKTRVFVTHGGYNSIQEAINAGKPLLVLPIFADQPRNANRVIRLGIGIAVRKNEISAEKIARSLRSLLEDDRYTKAATRLSRMIKKKPLKPHELLVKWSEFVAEFKELPNLTPYGASMNALTYHCLDVILSLLFAVILSMFITYKAVRYLFSCFRKTLRTALPKDKNE
ncbi:hypothetical protein AB6A40_009609 [Gnathostoma spinigerum]|uniref:UDP-glucuronosyltransferase n=1 Tax=Gnathostoma spinigerum TaxID=75299 RepID=A0ABD6ETP4_9BILA